MRSSDAPSRQGWLLIALALAFVAVFLIAPLMVVCASALEQGLDVCLQSLRDSEVLHSVTLTLLAAAFAVTFNLVFGLGAAWLLSNYDFPGRDLIVAMIDLPLSVSPVISGLALVLVCGAHGWIGHWLQSIGVQVIFAVPGIVIAITFVTFPIVAREVLNVMEARGSHEELAALTLGATGWQTFFRITLPQIKWGVLYSIVLCGARAMGEFGAVSAVSGHIRGKTMTLPLQIELLYNDYDFTAAFSAASLFVLLAVLTLTVKQCATWLNSKHRDASAGHSVATASLAPGAER